MKLRRLTATHAWIGAESGLMIRWWPVSRWWFGVRCAGW